MTDPDLSSSRPVDYVSPNHPNPPSFPSECAWRADDFKIGWGAFWLGIPRGDPYFWAWCKGWDLAATQAEWLAEKEAS